MSLMQDAIVIMLRDDAVRHDEWATKKFWLYVLTKFVFTESRWIVSSEQPPASLGTQRRVDMVVEDGSRGKISLLMFIEAKKSRAGGGDQNPEYGQSCYGSCSRFWAFDFRIESNTFPTPVFPVEGNFGDESAYADFQTFEPQIMAAFRYVKENPPPPDSGFDESPADSGTSDLGLDGLDSPSTGILTADAVTLVRVVRIRSRGPEVETRDGSKMRTEEAGWSPAQCLVDGQLIDGYKYVGSSETVYWTMNSISS